MMDNLKVIKTEKSKAREEVIDMLEKTSEQAKGESIEGLAIVLLDAEGTVTTAYTYNKNYFEMLGGLVELQHRIVLSASVDEDVLL